MPNERFYNNWSLFHKDVGGMTDAHLAQISAKVHADHAIQEFPAGRAVAKKAATDNMREWVESHFTRLVEFAFYDCESDNGYACRA